MILKGGPSGKGTDVCAQCGGAKEPTRHRSQLCRSCDAAKGSSTRKFRVGPISVGEGTWNVLYAEAAVAGVSPYVMARRVLEGWARELAHGEQSASPSTDIKEADYPVQPRGASLSDSQLARARKWIADTERTLPENITTRRQLRVWLEEQGFKP